MDRDRGACDDDVAAVVARRQSPRFIANKFPRSREGGSAGVSQSAASDRSRSWVFRKSKSTGLVMNSAAPYSPARRRHLPENVPVGSEAQCFRAFRRARSDRGWQPQGSISGRLPVMKPPVGRSRSAVRVLPLNRPCRRDGEPALLVKGFGWRPIVAIPARSEGRRPKASQEGTRGPP